MPGSSLTPTVSSSLPRRERAESPSVWQTCSPLLSPGGLSSASPGNITPLHKGEDPSQWGTFPEMLQSDTLTSCGFIERMMAKITHGSNQTVVRYLLHPSSYLSHPPPNIKPRSREFITNQPLTPFPMPPPKPCSNCLHPVIRQINGRAWNVAFTSTKVKCCREGGAFWLWRVDYALWNPLNASIIWWSCQFAVCALSLPHFLFLLPPEPKPTLLQHFWGGSEVWRGGDTFGEEGITATMLPGIPTSPKLKITVLMSFQNLCHIWICII